MTIAYEANGISVEMRTRSIAAHSRMSNVVTPGSAVYVEIHDVLRAAGREIEEIIEKKVPEKTL